MIFPNSLPGGKTFFASIGLAATTVAMLTRLVVACLSGLRSASAAADAVRTDPRHRAQVMRFLARHRWSADWFTLVAVTDFLLRRCLAEKGEWVFILDQTYHTTCGLRSQNTFHRGNNKKRAKKGDRRQKKTHKHNNHCFVFGLLISPETGTRLPCVRSYYTKDYCAAAAAAGRDRATAPVYKTQADIAAEMIQDLRVPAGAPVLVLGDTAFEAKQIRKACAGRGFDWIVPANPERRLAGPKPRPTLKSACRNFTAESMTRITLVPDEGPWRRPSRGTKAKSGKTKYARRYLARAETLDVLNIGKVRCVFSTTKEPNAGKAVEIQKILLSNRTDRDEKQIVSAYAVRWQIEVFFKEMKSNLGMGTYRFRDFKEVEGWVQACCVAFCYLEYYRLELTEKAAEGEAWRLRASGLARLVLRDIERLDLQAVAEEMQTEQGRARLRDALARAAPLELRKAVA